VIDDVVVGHLNGLADCDRYEGRFEGDLRIYDQAGSNAITAVDRRRAVEALEEAARSAPGNDNLISVKTTCSDSLNESAMVNSNGIATFSVDSCNSCPYNKH